MGMGRRVLWGQGETPKETGRRRPQWGQEGGDPYGDKGETPIETQIGTGGGDPK